MIVNSDNELILSRIVTGWCICMDYRKLSVATKKDHFLLPFIAQMLDRLAGKDFYCFYRRFVKGFSQIVCPLNALLEVNRPYVFDNDCLDAFETLKYALTTTPILIAPDWTQPFILMCDVSDVAVGTILGQKKGNLIHPISYASKTLNDSQEIRWVMLLQEFDIDIKDRKETENQVADHLSRLENQEIQDKQDEIRDAFPDECLFKVEDREPWYAGIVNYLPPNNSLSTSTLNRRNDLYTTTNSIFGMNHFFTNKVPTPSCISAFQKKRHNASLLSAMILLTEGINFMGPFPIFCGQQYILLAVDYVSKWVEAVACAKNNAATVSKFLTKNIFTCFGMPRAMVSDEDTHFINRIISKLLAKYNIRQKIATVYHPQTNGQAEVSNRKIQMILEKVVNASRKDWAQSLSFTLEVGVQSFLSSEKAELEPGRRE
ncbi:uncharacterized protein LOC120081092 [Benincasa hispida]|uniref:uncharacterized protein LOC120081092 n=1 Tax=Benincasa hispida TaxID=102211 RepID=UPI0018FFAF77|nr:uncharacterized protein LOC120081092 [Benincasa hispida]